jgi:zinc transport system substrate-binding protein
MKIIFVKLFGRAIGVALTLAALVLTGCGPQPAGQPGPAGRLQVVAAFYPFQFVAERVAGAHAVVTSLTAPGAEPHDLELTPRQVAAVTRADLVVYERTFQAAVDEAVDQSGNPNVLDTSTVVPLQPLAAGLGRRSAADEQPAGHALDPHVWLDPTNLAAITRAVAARLSATDPDHATDYAANAARLEAELSRLDRSYAQGLSSCRQTEFVTTHAAFGYLARRYHLEQIAVNGLSPDSEPSPTRIAAVQQVARQHGLTTIFYETLASPDVARSIAGDLGLRTDVLDPIEGITDSSRGRDYLAVMESNLTALRKADQCR